MDHTGSRKWAWLVGVGVLTGIAARPATAVEITAIETVALRFETAPGAGATYQLFNLALLNDAGEVLFWADDSNGEIRSPASTCLTSTCSHSAAPPLRVA